MCDAECNKIVRNLVNWTAVLPSVVVWVVIDEVIGGWLAVSVLKEKLFNCITNMPEVIQILIHVLKAYVWQTYNDMTYPKCVSVTLKACSVKIWTGGTNTSNHKVTLLFAYPVFVSVFTFAIWFCSEFFSPLLWFFKLIMILNKSKMFWLLLAEKLPIYQCLA